MRGNHIIEQQEMATAQQLQRINLALNSASSEELQAMITSAAAEMTGSEKALLLMLDATSGEFQLASGGDDGALKVPIEGSIGGWILRHGEAFVSDGSDPQLEAFVETRRSGNQSFANVAAVPLEMRGRIIGVLEVMNKQLSGRYDQQDIQHLKALAALAALASDNKHLLQQTDTISEFMHELKTPLMALTAASELLARDLQSKKQVELVEMIQRETMRLSNMAQDFLDLTRLESGRAEIAREPVDLVEIIHDVVQLQEPQAAARDITIAVNVDGDLPLVSGDYDRLRQVFLNLTSNAIKYNEDHGRIMIDVCQLDGELEVEIADTGPGIASENLPHLFERFYRIPDSEGFTKGTGLGLSIAARLVREHGGRIEVESELGRGSIFRCYLPLQS